MITAWKEAMAFDGRRRLGEIHSPTLALAGSKDTAVPMHHARMLHEGIRVVGSSWSTAQGTDSSGRIARSSSVRSTISSVVVRDR